MSGIRSMLDFDPRWTPELSYVIGLITTDGSLSNDGRHIILTSKDVGQLELFARLLGLKNKIGIKFGSFKRNSPCYQLQFGNIKMYEFLLRIGLMPNKTKIIGAVNIPDEYFGDYLRGHFDGDGYSYSYWDPRWKSSFMLHLGFLSASRAHIDWLYARILELYHIKGRITFQRKSVYRLSFAKYSSLKLLNVIYHKRDLPCLRRKYEKIATALSIIRNQAGMLELVDRLP